MKTHCKQKYDSLHLWTSHYQHANFRLHHGEDKIKPQCLDRLAYSLVTTSKTILDHLDDWLTVHLALCTLVDLQLDAQNSYLFTYNTFIKILYMFRALPCSSSGGLRRSCIYAASGIVTLCRWLSCAPVKKELQFFLNLGIKLEINQGYPGSCFILVFN